MRYVKIGIDISSIESQHFRILWSFYSSTLINRSTVDFIFMLFKVAVCKGFFKKNYNFTRTSKDVISSYGNFKNLQAN